MRNNDYLRTLNNLHSNEIKKIMSDAPHQTLVNLKKKAKEYPTLNKALAQMLYARKGNVHKVKGDGECLFYAVAYGMLYYMRNEQRPTTAEYEHLAKILRIKTVSILQKRLNNAIRNGRYESIYPMLTSTSSTASIPSQAQKYINNMRKSCTWGGQLEVQVL